MLRKLFLLFLLFFHIYNVNISASENVSLEVKTDFFTICLRTGTLVFIVGAIIGIVIRVNSWLNPVDDKSYKSFESKLMSQNNQKFFGNIIGPMEKLINVLKIIPPVQSPSSRLMSWVYSRSNENSINPELCKLLQKGYILYGPPGHGKNYVIQEMKNILAKDSDPANQAIPFMFVNGDFNTKYVGGAAHNWKITIDGLKKCIQKTPKKIGFLVIDECEKLFEKRTQDNAGNIVNQILSTIDGFNTDNSCKIIIIGLTNLIEYIDPGIVNRCQTIYFFQEKNNLKKIVTEKLNSMSIQIDELQKFIASDGIIAKRSIDSSNGVPLVPRDLDWILSEIFTEWCCDHKHLTYQRQEDLVSSFDESSVDQKSNYLNKAFIINWNHKPPLLYSNALRLAFN